MNKHICIHCNRPTPNQDEIDEHDHRDSSNNPTGPCNGCFKFCWSVVNDGVCQAYTANDGYKKAVVEIYNAYTNKKESKLKNFIESLIKKTEE